MSVMLLTLVFRLSSALTAPAGRPIASDQRQQQRGDVEHRNAIHVLQVDQDHVARDRDDAHHQHYLEPEPALLDVRTHRGNPPTFSSRQKWS